MSIIAVSARVRERAVEVARLRLSLPAGDLVGEMLPFWPDEFTGLWALRLADGDLGRVVVVMVEGDEIAPHAGLQRAAARLERLRILERPPPHTTQSIRPILDAVGGLSPAVPPHPHESFEPDARAGIRVVLSEPADWVRFAASGGQGPVPATDVTGFGVRAPAVRGRMVCAIDVDYRLSWTYEVEGVEIAAFEGRPEADVPDEADPLLAERLISAARGRKRSPWAMPSFPVRRAGTPSADAWEVAFLAAGTVTVNESDLVSAGPVRGG